MYQPLLTLFPTLSDMQAKPRRCTGQAVGAGPGGRGCFGSPAAPRRVGHCPNHCGRRHPQGKNPQAERRNSRRGSRHELPGQLRGHRWDSSSVSRDVGTGAAPALTRVALAAAHTVAAQSPVALAAAAAALAAATALTTAALAAAASIAAASDAAAAASLAAAAASLAAAAVSLAAAALALAAAALAIAALALAPAALVDANSCYQADG